MKIMIETGMTEMPNGCDCCKHAGKATDSAFCLIKRRERGFYLPRPDWCPLVEVEDG